MPMSPRLLRPRAAVSTAFDPRAITGLMGWWDFSDAATLGPTSSGTGTVSNNGPVKYVADKSGAGRHMIQTGADSVAPSLLTASQNGLAVLSFDGGDRLRATGSITLTEQTSFQVMFDNASGGNARSLSQGLSDASGAANAFDYNLTGHYVQAIKTGSTLGSYASSAVRAGVSISQSQWFVYSSQHTGQLISNQVNNGTAATYAHTLNATFAVFSIGSAVQNPEGGFWTGRIAETVIYSRSLSDAERETVARYLGRKWGITVA